MLQSIRERDFLAETRDREEQEDEEDEEDEEEQEETETASRGTLGDCERSAPFQRPRLNGDRIGKPLRRS